MNILIIGGGVAAFEAALAAAANENCHVTLCSEETVPPYRRPALSRMVAEEMSDTAFFFKQSSFYQERNITLELGKKAVAVNREKKEVSFADGSVLSYDRLVLATGGYAFVPPVPGAEYTHTLRNYADLQFFRKRLTEGVKEAVIIGAGVLGLELADSLVAKGCHVTLIEAKERILSRNLDDNSARMLMEQLRTIPQITLKTCESVQKITADSVVLERETLPSELTVFSTGIRSNVTLAAEAGLQVGHGIIVDEKMATSDPCIFSCGDAAEPASGCCGLLGAAKNMGHIAGTNAAGGSEIYVPESYPIRLMALGIKLFAAGKCDDAASEVTVDNGNYQRLTRNAEGALTGIVLIGDLKAAVKLQKELVC